MAPGGGKTHEAAATEPSQHSCGASTGGGASSGLKLFLIQAQRRATVDWLAGWIRVAPGLSGRVCELRQKSEVVWLARAAAHRKYGVEVGRGVGMASASAAATSSGVLTPAVGDSTLCAVNGAVNDNDNNIAYIAGSIVASGAQSGINAGRLHNQHFDKFPKKLQI